MSCFKYYFLRVLLVDLSFFFLSLLFVLVAALLLLLLFCPFEAAAAGLDFLDAFVEPAFWLACGLEVCLLVTVGDDLRAASTLCPFDWLVTGLVLTVEVDLRAVLAFCPEEGLATDLFDTFVFVLRVVLTPETEPLDCLF